MLSEVVSQKALSVSFMATQITAEVLINVMEKVVNKKTRDKKLRETTGKQSLKELRKKGIIQEIDIKENSYQILKKFLKKYNIDYSILKDLSKENTYSLFFRNYDAEILQKAMNGLLKDKFQKGQEVEKKESIDEKIKKAQDKSKLNKLKDKIIEGNKTKRRNQEI